MVSNVVTNDNILKLRELADKLCGDQNPKTPHKQVLDEIRFVLESESENLAKERSRDWKLKCYENMSNRIKIILDKLK